MQDIFLIVGAGVMQGPAIRFAKERGLFTVAVDGASSAPCAGLADRFVQIDLKNKEGIETLARELNAEGLLAGIMTAGTDFSATVAYAAEGLGLPGIPYETALDASDKERMRRRFRDAGVPSPDFLVLRSIPDSSFSLPLSYPVVVKPVDNMGSRGCRRADDSEALSDAVADALRYSRSGRVIVEEYMEGPEFSVDALVHEGELTLCGLADRHIFFPPYFIEMGHTIPSALPAEEAAKLLEVFYRGVRALGITNGAAKGDVKLTAKGPMIGEIAARLSGGYMSGWTYPYASGVEPTRGAISIALGEKPAGLEPVRNWTCAERAFISIPGTVASLQGVKAARDLPGVKELFLRVDEGSVVFFPENNVSKCGNVIAALPDRKEAVAAAALAARSVLIRLEAPNDATDAFLAALGSPFPPDAYVLAPELRAALEKLDEGVPGPIVTGAGPALLPFPEFLTSSCTDYVGRSVGEGLEAVRVLTGLDLPILDGEAARVEGRWLLGRNFWRAFVRGGYQGAAYFVDLRRRSAGRGES